MLLCESIVEDMFSLAVGLRRIEIGIRLSVCGVKDWILVSAQISERLFIEENAPQFTVVGQQELSRERLQFSHSSNRSSNPLLAAVRLPRLPQQPQRNYRLAAVGRITSYIPRTECYADGTEAMFVVNTSPNIAVNVQEGRLLSRLQRG